MPKYRITWNGGWGGGYEEVEADNIEDANDMAYENAKDEAESGMDWNAELIEDEEDA